VTIFLPLLEWSWRAWHESVKLIEWLPDKF
jgi:hypothetical protein